MPCRSAYCFDSKEELEKEVHKISSELDLTTRFACECLTKLEEENLPIPEYIKDWWEKHKEWDRRREEMEQKQKDIENAKNIKTQQLLNAIKNGVETLFPHE